MKIAIKVDKQKAIMIKKEIGIDLKVGLQKLADNLVESLTQMIELKKQHPEMDLKTIAERFKSESAKT